MKTTNTLGALLALSILGCSGDLVPLDGSTAAACTPGESRACTCATGAAGAQVCEGDGSGLGPCVCAVDDGGFEELDAGVIFEVDAGRRDAGVPVARDAGHDGGALDAGPTWEGECDLVTQEGCRDDEACRRGWGPGDVSVDQVPTGEPECQRGVLGFEDWRSYPGGCRSDGDRCSRGAFCDPVIGVCLRYCDPAGAACPPTWDGAETWCNCISGLQDCYCDAWPRETWRLDGGV